MHLPSALEEECAIFTFPSSNVFVFSIAHSLPLLDFLFDVLSFLTVLSFSSLLPLLLFFVLQRRWSMGGVHEQAGCCRMMQVYAAGCRLQDSGCGAAGDRGPPMHATDAFPWELRG